MRFPATTRLLPLLMLAGCGVTQPLTPDGGHLSAPVPRADDIPQPVAALPALPVPKPAPRSEVYSVVVNNVAVDELLFALARDAKVNVDIHPGIDGKVTLNAINQTLPQLLERIANQVDMRWELNGHDLTVMPETAFVKHYQVDYVNMARKMNSRIAIATSIAATGGTAKTTGGGNTSTASNASDADLVNVSENQFWTSVRNGLVAILESTAAAKRQELARREKLEAKRAMERMSPEQRAQIESGQQAKKEGLRQDAEIAARAGAGASKLFDQLRQADAAAEPAAASAAAPAATAGGASAEERNVIVHAETGTVTVVATSRQHKEIQRFLQQVTTSAQRQVLIEATILEVDLSDQFQSGIDWSRIAEGTRTYTNGGVSLTPSTLSNAPFTAFTFNIANPRLFSGTFASTIKLLESFGKTKVISSPKIMALNNQPALLKVVEEKVYFTTDIKITDATSTTPEKREYTSVINTVPVGVVMSVTPQISESGAVSLNIRPTISNITGYKQDPVPRLLKVDFDNLIPEIEVREMESTLKLMSGQVAVLGGLIRDKIEYKRDGLPWVSRLPGLGTLASQRNDTTTKGELVIFLRPVLINDPSVNGDLAQFKGYMADKDFFNRKPDEIATPILGVGGK